MDDNLVGNNAAHIVRAKELFWAMIQVYLKILFPNTA